jgi:hypothetical protein
VCVQAQSATANSRRKPETSFLNRASSSWLCTACSQACLREGTGKINSSSSSGRRTHQTCQTELHFSWLRTACSQACLRAWKAQSQARRAAEGHTRHPLLTPHAQHVHSPVWVHLCCCCCCCCWRGSTHQLLAEVMLYHHDAFTHAAKPDSARVAGAGAGAALLAAA